MMKSLQRWIGIILGVVSLILWIIRGGEQTESQLKDSHTPLIQMPDQVHEPDPHQIIIRVRELVQHKDDLKDWCINHPNKFYEPGNGNNEYAENYRRHNQIAQYYYSPIKNHPSMQKLLHQLVANGYDVFEWVNAIVILTQYHLPVFQAQQKMIQSGFSPPEIEMFLSDIKQKQIAQKDWHVSEFKRWSKIKDDRFIHEILDMEFPLDLSQPTMLGRKKLKPGDRFLTDDDWK